MKKQKTPEVIRQDIPALRADPDQGLTMQQAEARKAGGWANAADTGLLRRGFGVFLIAAGLYELFRKGD